MKILLPLAPLLLTGSILACSQSKEPENSNQNPASGVKTSIPETARDKKTGKDEHKVTFVELGSVNCIPCKMMQPVMKAIEREFGPQVKIVFHDVWTEKGKRDAEKYGIRVIPTQVFLDSGGNEYYRHEGFYPQEEVVKILKMKGVN